jgi:8-oxo-dGTP diphosphatase
MWRATPSNMFERMMSFNKKCRDKEDVYVCEHPARFLLELPNLIVAEQGDDIKDIPFPKWCPIEDKVDPGVRVGVTGIIVRDGKVLLGLRGDGCQTARNEWAYPGGRMDYGEDPLTSLPREIQEETTMLVEAEDLEFLTWMNEFFPEDKKHYVSLVFMVNGVAGVPIVTEPDKCKEWKWFDPDDIPDNTFWACKKNIEKYKNKIKNSG